MKYAFSRGLTTVAIAASLVTVSSCNLDRQPLFEPGSEEIFKDFANYKPALAKIYAGLAISGQQGPSGRPDITGLDEGFTNYLRGYWKAQELTTDEAIIGWADGNLPAYQNMNWTSGNEFIRAMYDRIFYQIGLCNEFLRQTTDAKLSERGISDADKQTVKAYRAEARFMRALSYWHALDMFGNVPFVTEADAVGATPPPQYSRLRLFNFVESELLAIDSDLVAARQNEYGRADRAAAWTLLAKLYLNSVVYTGVSNTPGTPRYDKCITYCDKVLGAGYTLQTTPSSVFPAYARNFLADNNTSPEFIFTTNFDGVRTQGYGGTTFIIHAAVGGRRMKPGEQFGISSGGWAGTRAKKNLPLLFPDTTQACPDKRFLFYTSGQRLEITAVDNFNHGFAVKKFRNVLSTPTSTGALQSGQDASGTFTDTDWPVFRLADVNLMYAEATIQGGAGGDRAKALRLLNDIRNRAYGNASGITNGNITNAAMNMQYIQDERARELYWEGYRRTDLIRFGKFTSGTYVWPYKGNTPAGQGVDAKFNLFPIPVTDLSANPNLVQNPGY